MNTNTQHPCMSHKMPAYPSRHPDVLEAAARWLRDKAWVRLEGAKETEKALEEFHGGGRAWFISSGTHALQALYLGHEIGPGDEVITTPYTWGATVSSILAVGATPVFADVDLLSGQILPEAVEAAITPRTKAIVAVYLFGRLCPIEALRAIADRHGLLLLEDGSQAHGARVQGRRIGLFGHGSAFSCMGLKVLAGTEGGYALFPSLDVAEKAFLYGAHPRGLDPAQIARLQEQGLLDSLQLGWRPCAVSAELVRAHLPYLQSEIDARRANFAHLSEELKDCPAFTIPQDRPGDASVHHLFSFLYHPERTGIERAEFIKRVNQCGLIAFVYIPTPIHRMYRLNPHDYRGPRVFWHEQLQRSGIDYRKVSCPNAEARSRLSVEIKFDWIVENRAAMKEMADCLRYAAGIGG